MVGGSGPKVRPKVTPLPLPLLPTAGSLVSLPMRVNASLATRNANPWRALPHAMARALMLAPSVPIFEMGPTV